MAENDDDVHSSNEAGGYGRPPKKHRIAPGETRNPWGRRGKPGSKPDFMDEQIEIRLDGRSRKVTRAQAVDLGLFQEAVKGNVSAAKELDRRRSQRDRTAIDSTANTLSESEQAALDRLIERRLAEEKSRPKPTTPVDIAERIRKAALEIAPGCKK